MDPSSLGSILRLFTGKPVGPVPQAKDWVAIESVIQRSIPGDYKAIVEHTGGESIGCCFIRNPAEQNNIFVALSRAALEREHILMGEIAMEKVGIALYPEPNGWVQLARKDQVYFMLKPEGDDIAIVDLSGWEVYEPRLTFSELMWTMFNDRKLFGGLGVSIWSDSQQFFGIDVRS